VIDVGNDGHVTDLRGVIHELADFFDGEIDHVVCFLCCLGGFLTVLF
jgi:hypothetical protein